MKITKTDLENMYQEHVELERIRLQKLFDEDKHSITICIIDQNKLGKKTYVKRYNEYSQFSENYFKTLIAHLQDIFVDSKIWISADDTIELKTILLNIDWS